MPSKAAWLAALVPLFASLAFAQCQMENVIDPAAAPRVVTNSNLCLGQGPEAWTLAMASNLACVPAPSPDPSTNTAGCAGGEGFWILDNTCTIRGAYAKPDCGVPYTIMENFLPYVMTIDIINTGIGQGYFSMYYGDGHYVINNNHCDCVSVADGLAANEECKCAFAINGIFSSTQRRGLGNGTDTVSVDIPEGVYTTFKA